MKFVVPIIKQKHKKACGATGMSMVYKYFDKDISEEEIIKEVGGLTKWGSFTVDHALMAKNLGFKVICYSYGLIYFEPSDTKLSRVDFIRKTKSLIKKEKRNYNKRELQSILRVLESDINFEMKMPSLNTIREFLDKKLPVCLTVNSAVLSGKKRNLRWGHFIVLTGYDKDIFYYNDPHYSKNKSISADKLIFALSNNIFDSSAYLLVIEK